jgi:hypothetical protein
VLDDELQIGKGEDGVSDLVLSHRHTPIRPCTFGGLIAALLRSVSEGLLTTNFDLRRPEKHALSARFPFSIAVSAPGIVLHDTVSLSSQSVRMGRGRHLG